MASSVEAEAQRWARELRRGSVRFALLGLLSEKERYGYEILAEVRTLVSQGTSEATLYPLLHEMEAGGFLRSRWRDGQSGAPPRKYYRVTPTGEKLRETFAKLWKEYRKEMDKVSG